MGYSGTIGRYKLSQGHCCVCGGEGGRPNKQWTKWEGREEKETIEGIHQTKTEEGMGENR
jgi:hypothetical protein